MPDVAGLNGAVAVAMDQIAICLDRPIDIRASAIDSPRRLRYIHRPSRPVLGTVTFRGKRMLVNDTRLWGLMPVRVWTLPTR